MDTWSFEVRQLSRIRHYKEDEEDLPLGTLLQHLWNIRSMYPYLNAEELKTQWMQLSFELHRRTAMAFSPLALVLVGIPLGIRAHRKSTGAGVALSLLLFFAFYVMTLLAQSFAKVPAAHPDVLIWAPILVFSVVGVRLMRRRG